MTDQDTTNRDRCRVCQSDEFVDACRVREARYVRCCRCGVTRQYPYPTPAEVDAYYRHYQTLKSADSSYLTDAGVEAMRRDKGYTFADLGLPADFFAGRRVCDVGCATGDFLQMLRAAPHGALTGVDLSEQCVEIARQRDLDVTRGEFTDLAGPFDVVTMWHVIEHLPYPTQYLQHAARVLAPGGSLLVETPATGAIASAFGADWRFYLPVEHINLFSQEALFAAGREAGFSIRAWTRFGSGNTSGQIPAPNKRAMDRLVKQLGCGDTLAVWFVRH